MTFKEFLLLHLQIFFVLVTLIFAASTVVGLIVIPEQNLRYSQLIGPFVIAALCVLPTFITYFKKEPTLKQYIIRHIIQFVVIEGIVLFFIDPPAGGNKVLFYIIIGAIVLIIYALTKFIILFQKYRQSKKLTEQLQLFQAENN